MYFYAVGFRAEFFAHNQEARLVVFSVLNAVFENGHAVEIGGYRACDGGGFGVVAGKFDRGGRAFDVFYFDAVEVAAQPLAALADSLVFRADFADWFRAFRAKSGSARLAGKPAHYI